MTVVVMLGASAGAPAHADKRIALVIGNGAYQNAPQLPNPPNDAHDVAEALKRIGFDVILGLDFDKAKMDEAEIKFSRSARNADVAVFYYSGHAMQFAGTNYLVPTDAVLMDEADLRRMIKVDDIVADLQQAKTLRILVLDSCRDNPMAEELKRSIGPTRAVSVQRGLAKIDSPEGMIVSYSTQAGRTAADGSGRNSPYTTAFLKHIEEQDEVGTVFRRIATDVYDTTGHEQLPELSLSFVGEFYLHGRLDVTVTTKPSPPDPCAAAAEHWKSAEAIGTLAAFEDHLARFPSCAFAGLAKARIEGLKNKVAVVTPPAVASINLTGTWAANDGGTYTIRQTGSDITWEGVSRDGGRTWSHTFNGVIRNNTIVGRFFDHPPGRIRNAGELTLRIVDADRFEMLVPNGHFGGSVWIRTGSVRP
jgi:Caspase domain